MTKRLIGHIGAPPNSVNTKCEFRSAGGTVELTYEFETGDEPFVGGVRFRHTRSQTFDPEPLSTRWQVEDAYQKLVEVEDSEWAAKAVDKMGGRWPFPVRHFLVYIEDVGAFEILGSDCEWITTD